MMVIMAAAGKRGSRTWGYIMLVETVVTVVMALEGDVEGARKSRGHLMAAERVVVVVEGEEEAQGTREIIYLLLKRWR